MCIEWRDVTLGNLINSGDAKFLEVMFLPCNMPESKLLKGQEDQISANCNEDYSKLWKYLGTIELLIYSNSCSF